METFFSTLPGEGGKIGLYLKKERQRILEYFNER